MVEADSGFLQALISPSTNPVFLSSFNHRAVVFWRSGVLRLVGRLPAGVAVFHLNSSLTKL